MWRGAYTFFPLGYWHSDTSERKADHFLIRDTFFESVIAGLYRVKTTRSTGGFGFSAQLFKIEEVFKFLIQRDAEDQRQLSRRAEMPCFNGADGIAGYADPFGKLRLGEPLFRSDCFQAVFQDELIVQRITALQSGRYGEQIVNMAGRGQQ